VPILETVEWTEVDTMFVKIGFRTTIVGEEDVDFVEAVRFARFDITLELFLVKFVRPDLRAGPVR
jgi:hypothetical protein